MLACVTRYVHSYVVSARSQADLIMDWDELEQVMGASLQKLLWCRVLAGYFSAASPNPGFYAEISATQQISRPLSNY